MRPRAAFLLPEEDPQPNIAYEYTRQFYESIQEFLPIGQSCVAVGKITETEKGLSGLAPKVTTLSLATEGGRTDPYTWQISVTGVEYRDIWQFRLTESGNFDEGLETRLARNGTELSKRSIDEDEIIPLFEDVRTIFSDERSIKYLEERKLIKIKAREARAKFLAKPTILNAANKPVPIYGKPKEDREKVLKETAGSAGLSPDKLYVPKQGMAVSEEEVMRQILARRASATS